MHRPPLVVRIFVYCILTSVLGLITGWIIPVFARQQRFFELAAALFVVACLLLLGLITATHGRQSPEP